MPNKKLGQQKKQQAKRERRSAQRKERAKKIAAQERDKRSLERALEIKRQRRAEFPDFVFREKYGNPEFVAIVKEAIGRFDFAELDKFDRNAFSMMKDFGAEHTWAAIKNNMRKLRKEGVSNKYTDLGDILWGAGLGHAIFSHIPDDVKHRFLPMNDVHFQYHGNAIVAKFRSLLTQKSSGRTIYYYSRYKPTINSKGKKYIVGFSMHAIERLTQRRGMNPLRYADLGEAYAYFEDCQYFKLCTLPAGNLAFSFFDECFDRTPQLQWAKTILGIKEVDPTKGKLYYRVGYCPIRFDKGFAKAKTLLLPGFEETPEYEALNKAHLPVDTKRRLQRLAKAEDSIPRLLETDDVSALKWFHDNGVPQVIQTTEPLFRGDTFLAG